jgi:SAM-dependent methyltransferase
MIEITEHDRFYWSYEYDVVAKYLIPLLEANGVNPKGLRLLDVGCGDGGGLAAMVDSGMICKGFDIHPRRIELAQAMNGGRQMDLREGDIYRTPVPFAGETFDLVVLHDVFEHLDDKERVLRVLAAYLGPSGKLMITFPPFYSAFGGHQQLLRTWFARLPFMHLVPGMVSGIVPRLKRESPEFVEEVRKLARLRMGIGKFERLLEPARLRVVERRTYLISPNHIRFGLRPLASGIVGQIPALREVLTSGVVYVLERAER